MEFDDPASILFKFFWDKLGPRTPKNGTKSRDLESGDEFVPNHPTPVVEDVLPDPTQP